MSILNVSEVFIMIKNLLKKAITKYNETEKEISKRQAEHDELRKRVIQNHKETSARIDKMREEWVV